MASIIDLESGGSASVLEDENVDKVVERETDAIWWLRIFLSCCFIALVLIARFTSVGNWLTISGLRTHRLWLLEISSTYRFSTIAGFLIIYTAVVSFVIPGATVLTLAAGVLWPQPFATAVASFGAAVGACCAFLITRTTLGNSVKSRAEKFYLMRGLKQRLETGSQASLLITLAGLRLVPFFPFWFINSVPAMLGCSFRAFALSTFIGIAPGTFVLTQSGKMLSDLLEWDATHPMTEFVEDGSLYRFFWRVVWSWSVAIPVLLLLVWAMMLLFAHKFLVPHIDRWLLRGSDGRRKSS